MRQRGWICRCIPNRDPSLLNGLGSRCRTSTLPISQAVPGDIAVQDGTDPANGMNHVGICMDNQCSTVLSNAGTTGTLCGTTNTTMSNNGYNYPSSATTTFYHITIGPGFPAGGS